MWKYKKKVLGGRKEKQSVYLKVKATVVNERVAILCALVSLSQAKLPFPRLRVRLLRHHFDGADTALK